MKRLVIFPNFILPSLLNEEIINQLLILNSSYTMVSVPDITKDVYKKHSDSRKASAEIKKQTISSLKNKFIKSNTVFLYRSWPNNSISSLSKFFSEIEESVGKIKVIAVMLKSAPVKINKLFLPISSKKLLLKMIKDFINRSKTYEEKLQSAKIAVSMLGLFDETNGDYKKKILNEVDSGVFINFTTSEMSKEDIEFEKLISGIKPDFNMADTSKEIKSFVNYIDKLNIDMRFIINYDLLNKLILS